ncbi:methyl-accepting chemotaxis protein [uncultured Helicobacter sp.]|uniref:methyl-accepting chemotaxis protein n=1 Tax=uncultured Helicobacter sp. TaxID=175537 RepID=UPI00258F00C3|nr:methyl-accepting chemotaxis protein [uncultured Helicobacter sp.]
MALTRLSDIRPMFQTWLDTINEFINLEENKNQSLTPVVESSALTLKSVLITITIISILLCAVIAFFIIRYLVNVLGGEPNVTSKSVNLIASGNLQESIHCDKKGSILDDIAIMQNKLKNTGKEILGLANDISANTHLVANASNDSKKASILQNESAKKSADEIRRITEEVVEITSIAKQTEENSEKTLDLSTKGQEAMANTTQTIDVVTQMVMSATDDILQLEKQSQEVRNSATLIAEIADQTNLLALNAAIEAARAGEHGRGFAVVADEVRKLAERTSDTTSQIATMIQGIQEEIQNIAQSMTKATPEARKSMELASQTSEILDEIKTQAQDSLMKVKDVSNYSAKQAESTKGIESKMEEMTKASSAMTELMQKNSEIVNELENISDKLKQNVGFFKI